MAREIHDNLSPQRVPHYCQFEIRFNDRPRSGIMSFCLVLPNEPVEKVLWARENDVFRGHLPLPKYKIVDCDVFCEAIFFCISPKNLLGDFFYSLNVWGEGCA